MSGVRVVAGPYLGDVSALCLLPSFSSSSRLPKLLLAGTILLLLLLTQVLKSICTHPPSKIRSWVFVGLFFSSVFSTSYQDRVTTTRNWTTSSAIWARDREPTSLGPCLWWGSGAWYTCTSLLHSKRPWRRRRRRRRRSCQPNIAGHHSCAWRGKSEALWASSSRLLSWKLATSQRDMGAQIGSCPP